MLNELHFYLTEEEAKQAQHAAGYQEPHIKHLSIQSQFLGYRARKVYDHVRWDQYRGHNRHQQYLMMLTCEWAIATGRTNGSREEEASDPGTEGQGP